MNILLSLLIKIFLKAPLISALPSQLTQNTCAHYSPLMFHAHALSMLVPTMLPRLSLPSMPHGSPSMEELL